jgi:hypothetical protein
MFEGGLRRASGLRGSLRAESSRHRMAWGMDVGGYGMGLWALGFGHGLPLVGD